jgi:intracellular sulfur oxidation DsrE/DsrF family protein
MSLDWSALGQVTVVSIGATVAVVVVFTLGVLALSRREESTGAGGGTAALAGAGLCFAVCAAAVLYGLYLIIPQFHN